MERREEDHPRVCGEKVLASIAAMSVAGSPPRVRGKVALHLTLSQGQRITPACAGKSAFSPAISQRSKDHPRVCGEKILRTSLFLMSLGSPPRVRGKACIAVCLPPP